MAILGKSGFYGSLGSVQATGRTTTNTLGASVPEFVEYFLSGWAGKGWKLWHNGSGYELDLDYLKVRGTMSVYELLIDKIRALKGAMVISQGNGKIAEVESVSGYVYNIDDYTSEIVDVYELTLEEDEQSIVANDFIRCQTFNSNSVKLYHVQVLDVTSDGKIVVRQSAFTEYFPKVGDEIVQLGNSTDTTRQTAIYLHADDIAPAIDFMRGINDTDLSSHIVLRIGGALPNSPAEYNGLWVQNGTIISENDYGTAYELKPNGEGSLANNTIKWNVDGSGEVSVGTTKLFSWNSSGFTMGSGMKLTWENLDSDAQSNLVAKVYYSADGVNWHTKYQTTDVYFRVGESGDKVKFSGSGANAYCHVKFAEYEDGAYIFTSNDGADAGTYIGFYTSNDPNPPRLTSYYEPWIKVKGEDGAQGEKGADAVLPEWMSGWKQTTVISGEHIITPTLYVGTKSSDNKLSGFSIGHAMNKESIGAKATAINGFYQDDLVMMIDPASQKFFFNGDFQIKGGKFMGIVGSPYRDYYDTDTSFDFRKGLNIRVGATSNNVGTISLPTTSTNTTLDYLSDYDGADADIICAIPSTGEAITSYVYTDGYVSGEATTRRFMLWGKMYAYIRLTSGTHAKLRGYYDSSKSTYPIVWIVENGYDFDFVKDNSGNKVLVAKSTNLDGSDTD